MGAILIRTERTGRGDGDKREEKVSSVTVAGVKMRLTEHDIWFGPCAPGDRGEYYRMTWLDTAAPVKWWRE